MYQLETINEPDSKVTIFWQRHTVIRANFFGLMLINHRKSSRDSVCLNDFVSNQVFQMKFSALNRTSFLRWTIGLIIYLVVELSEF